MNSKVILEPEQEFGALVEHSLDLQFFASAEDEGRTEDPTDKRRDEARQEGQIPRTEELSGALVMGAGFLIIWIFGSYMLWETLHFAEEMMSMEQFSDINQGNITDIFRTIMWTVIRIVAPVTSAAFFAGLAGHVSQVGFLFTAEPLKLDLSNLKFSGSQILEKLTLSKEIAWDLMMSVVKLVAVGIVALEVIYSEFHGIILLVDVELFEGILFVLELAFEIIYKTIIILLILSPIDWAFQKYQHEENLKMTPQQKDDERKQQEGDPEVKKKQKEKMRENAQRRIEEEVPEADVVITNPTHYAVALVYDEHAMEAPKVVAKGKDLLAQRIKQLAREHGVPVYEIPLLARTLYQLDIDQVIPSALYDAVATVLAWVETNRDNVSRQERANLEQKVKGLEIA